MVVSDQGSIPLRTLFGVDLRSVEGQAPPPEVHSALQRKLNNRHVAMIRQESLRAYFSLCPADSDFQHWRCHRYRPLPRNSTLPHEWRSPGSSIGLLVYWFDMFRYHGLSLSLPAPEMDHLIFHHSFLSAR